MSAYFPDEASVILGSSATDHSATYDAPIYAYERRLNLIEFPSERRILWDRQPEPGEEKVRYLLSKDIIPHIYIPPDVVASLIKELCTNPLGAGSIGKRLYLVETSILNQSERALIRSRNFKSESMPAYIFRMSSEGQLEGSEESDTCVLRVPISNRQLDDDRLTFDSNSTLPLVINLGRTIRQGRDFSLRSCIRIRAAASGARNNEQVFFVT